MGEELSWRTKYSTENALKKSSGGATWHARFKVRNLQGGADGNFTVLVQPHWAPVGARRFRRLLEEHFYDGARVFRVIRGFVAQWGIPGDPHKAMAWQYRTISDDLPRVSNKRGRLSFASSGLDSRTTQVFVNLGENRALDKDGALGGFAPFAEVVSGMEVVDALYHGYGEGSPRGRGPGQRQILAKGNAYLEKEFPLLSYIEGVDFEDNGKLGAAAQEEEHSGVLGRLGPVMLVVAPLLLVALYCMARVFCKVRRRFAADDDDGDEEARKKAGRAPKPQQIGAGPLE